MPYFEIDKSIIIKGWSLVSSLVYDVELKCKYFIKVNPKQVEESIKRKDSERGWKGGCEREEETPPGAILRGAFYCRFLLAA